MVDWRAVSAIGTVVTALGMGVNALYTARLHNAVNEIRAEMFEKFITKEDCREKRADCCKE